MECLLGARHWAQGGERKGNGSSAMLLTSEEGTQLMTSFVGCFEALGLSVFQRSLIVKKKKKVTIFLLGSIPVGLLGRVIIEERSIVGESNELLDIRAEW